jgi:pyruvate dehydrogenase E2 component (dihydrolipoamide acetyltransferase)
MAIEITVPRQGWTMEEGVFLGWLKSDGEEVRSGELLFRIEGDKAVQDVEAAASGVLRIAPGGPREGEAVKVGAVLGFLAAPGESLDALRTPAAMSPAASPAGLEPPGASPRGVTEREPAPDRRRPACTPRARRAAARLGVDWTRLKGSGRNGRIRERDVVARSRSQ